jgi:ABC-type branched-subunit amino acid transport system substrate-binding protein
MRFASGRFVRAAALAFLAGCAAPESDAGPPAPPAPADPVIVAGPIGAARQAQASELFARAEGALRSGDAEEALSLSTRVVEEFPSAQVSGRALMLQAQSALAAGEGETADGAAERYIDLVGAADPRVPELRVLQGRALTARPDLAVDRLARIGPGAPPEQAEEAVAIARQAVMDAPLSALEDAIGVAEAIAAEAAAAGAAAPVLPVLEARVAALLLRAGEDGRSSELARAALTHGATGPDAVLAESVLGGSLPEGYVTVRRVSLGAVLPLDGAPALSAFSALLLEGIQVAAATAMGPDFEVALEVQDDRGEPERTAELVAELERQGVSGVVGFLQDLSLEIAADAREAGVPLMSPTARVASYSEPGVYSLASVDPVGLAELARHAASMGYQRIALIESTSPLSIEESTTFRNEIAGFGIETAGRFSFVEGVTFFEEQILAARDSLRAAEIRALGLTEEDTLRVEALDPVAVFVPVPAEDVELIAPQITHFGLDTLGIDVLGTSGWADPQALRTVDQRHTDGVVATAPIGAGTDAPGYLRFKAAYEEHFQRTLVSPVPAAGYDAALLLLEALRAGGSGPSGIIEALESVGEVEGATGVFSVVDGRIVRRTHVVLIQNGILTPIPPG